MSSEILAQLATMSVEDMRELHQAVKERLSAIDSYDGSGGSQAEVPIKELVEAL